MTMAAFAAVTQAAVVIERLTVQQIEDGPVALPGDEFRPSETVHLSFRLAKFETIEDDDKQKLELSYRIEVVDANGTPVVAPHTNRIQTQALAEDRNWTPKGRWSFDLPDHAEPGLYEIRVTARDEIGKSEAKSTVKFRVAAMGRRVEPSGELVTRGFGFFGSEESTRALDPAIYHPGELVWVKFDVTGYKLGEKNAMDVRYGLEVIDSEGKTGFSQPEAAKEQFEGFYPKRSVPAAFNLTLPKDVKKGSYTLVVRIRDVVGKQELEVKREFRVE